MAFDAPTKLSKLREHLQTYNLDALLIPTEDPHNSEYPVKADARREYISGFTGSAGTALVGTEKAWLWTDGRYFLQAAEELDAENWTLMKSGTPDCPTVSGALKEFNLTRVGFDPFVHTSDWLKNTRKALGANSPVVLVPIHKGSKPNDADCEDLKQMKDISLGQDNLVDRVWSEDGSRPAYPKVPLQEMTTELAGASVEEKLGRIREKMSDKKAAVLMLASLDDIAWTYNLRGLDSPFSRIFLSYAIITHESAYLYLKEAECTERVANVKAHLDKYQIKLVPYEQVGTDVAVLIGEIDQSAEKNKVWVDSSVNLALTVLAKSAARAGKGDERVLEEAAPVRMMKAVKNSAELDGMIKAHIYDGVALACFFSWLEGLTVREFSALDEVTASDKLKSFRQQMTDFVALSFETIAGVDSNGAIIHYRPEQPSARQMNPKGMFLLDSGAHYAGGTTDVTRTVHFGIPTPWERELYTRVLMGHVDLASVVFPKKIYGCQLDVLSRQALWEIGMDFMHGTGHGVGHSLEVHEAPPNISYRCPPSPFDVPIEAGMVVSDEPGAYLDGKFGIRIENLMFAREQHTPHKFNDAQYLSFEMLTLSPYCRRLIEPTLLTPKQIKYINLYHDYVRTVLTPEIVALEGRLPNMVQPALAWLNKNTAEIRL